ncbi:MAG: IS1595 family transposase [Rhodospirillales bacterium]|nr:IS1595 family transposase [Rhodospirillales bacterium]
MKLDITNKIYNDPDAARAHLEEQLWPNGPVCPHCGSFNATALEGKAHRKGLYQCNEHECREQFSVTVGTVFERSKIGLHKWVLAAHLFAASKKGISSKQIQRMLGVTYKSAWFMTMRLREASKDKYASPIGGEGKIVESDETFVGGKKKNVHKGKPEPKKHAVHALVERGGEVRAKHVADVTAKTLREAIFTQASRKSEFHTDESLTYYWMGKEFAKHKTVNHSQDEYYKDGAGVQSAESFFAIMKRGITGSFHSVSEQHLQRYLDEFAFRWNNRSSLGIEDFERANQLVKGAAGRRLTYRGPDEAKDA